MSEESPYTPERIREILQAAWLLLLRIQEGREYPNSPIASDVMKELRRASGGPPIVPGGVSETGFLRELLSWNKST